MFIVGFDDAIADPIAEVARLCQRAVVEPIGKIGLVLVGDERRLNRCFVTFCDRPKAGGGNAAGCQFGREFGRAFDQRFLEDRGLSQRPIAIRIA